MGYSIEIEGIPSLKNKIERIKVALIENTRKAMHQSVFLLEARAKGRESWHTKTGRLFASIHGDVSGGLGEGLTGRVGTNVKYAPFIEFGTGLQGPLHKPIMPLDGKFMHFHAYGREWFLRSTLGQFADPFMRKALDDSEPMIREFFRDAVKDAIE